MKRRDLERRPRIAGCVNAKTGVLEAVPRHTEIKEPLARKILRNLAAD
ncbi:MAG: addiction module toxin, HicA family [Planctomycetaceae bacterium]